MMYLRKTTLHSFVSLLILNVVIGHQHHHYDNAAQHSKDQHSISTKELRKVSEELFERIPYGIYNSVFVNYQRQRESKDEKDEAPEPLISVPKDLLESIPTIDLMLKLHDNYDINSIHPEDVTPQESAEENDFIDGLLDTGVMMHAMDFLARKGYFRKSLHEYKRVLKKIWFQPYSRTNRTALGSTGFEHVFLVEKKRGNHITGMHNWIFFAEEEYGYRANYLGYIKKLELADKAAVLKFYLSYLNKTKLSSMFIGTPPEFEIALYTLCFYARPNKDCNVLLGNVKVKIQTWVQYSNLDELVGSSFPKI